MTYIKNKIIFTLSVIFITIVLLYISNHTQVKTETINYSGTTKLWKAQFAEIKYPNMKSEEYFSLSYLGNNSDIFTDIYVKFSYNNGYFEATRKLPKDSTIYFSSGSSYTFHGPSIRVQVKWNNTEEEFIIEKTNIRQSF